MNKVFYLLCIFAILTFASCSQKTTYKIECKLDTDTLNGQTVLCRNLTDKKIVDSAEIKNAKFVLTGKIPSDKICRLEIKDDEKLLRRMLVSLDSKPLYLTIDSGFVKAKGSDVNEAYYNMLLKQQKLYRKFFKETALLEAKVDTTNHDAVEKLIDETWERYDTTVKRVVEHQYDFVKKFVNTDLGKQELKTSFSLYDDVQKKEILGMISEDLKKKVQEQAPDNEETESLKDKELIGKPFVDVKGLVTPDNKQVSLGSCVPKGKVVLIDVWASWCGPCRASIPHIKELYKKYKKKGMEVVGISLDEKPGEWKNAMKELNMSWPQLADHKAWKSELAKTYGIKAIPRVILIDRNGVVAAINPKDKLEEEIKALLK